MQLMLCFLQQHWPVPLEGEALSSAQYPARRSIVFVCLSARVCSCRCGVSWNRNDKLEIVLNNLAPWAQSDSYIYIHTHPVGNGEAVPHHHC